MKLVVCGIEQHGEGLLTSTKLFLLLKEEMKKTRKGEEKKDKKSMLEEQKGEMQFLTNEMLIPLDWMLFCILTLRPGVICPVAFLRQAQDAAETGDFETLADLSRADASPVAKVLSAACEQYIPGRPLDLPALRQSMEEEGARQVGRLWGSVYIPNLSHPVPLPVL